MILLYCLSVSVALFMVVDSLYDAWLQGEGLR